MYNLLLKIIIHERRLKSLNMLTGKRKREVKDNILIYDAFFCVWEDVTSLEINSKLVKKSNFSHSLSSSINVTNNPLLDYSHPKNNRKQTTPTSFAPSFANFTQGLIHQGNFFSCNSWTLCRCTTSSLQLVSERRLLARREKWLVSYLTLRDTLLQGYQKVMVTSRS